MSHIIKIGDSPQGIELPASYQGAKGDKGEKGDKGDSGNDGPAGATGTKGDKGEKGDQGTQGIQGNQGPAGATGTKGDKGEKGDQGAQGIQGNQGPAGATGTKGDRGEKGDQGLQGVTGERGLPGPTGPKGDIGETGGQGIQGIQGVQGLPGPTGPKGDQGLPGTVTQEFITLAQGINQDRVLTENARLEAENLVAAANSTLETANVILNSMSETADLVNAGIALGGGSTSTSKTTTTTGTIIDDNNLNVPPVLFSVTPINAARAIYSSVYLDNLLQVRQELFLNNRASVFVNSELSSLNFSGTGYITKTTVPVIKTASASVLVGKKIAILTFFDSKSGMVLKNKYGQDDITWNYISRTQQNIIKDSIDSVAAGGGAIQRPVLVGPKSFNTRTETYKTTGDVVTRGGTYAIGSWNVANFLRHAIRLRGTGAGDASSPSGQASYALLGLKRQTGFDYTGSADQVELIRTTLQGKNDPDYTADVWDYLKTQSGWTGGSGSWTDNSTNRAYIDSWLAAKYANPDNVCFSLAKAKTAGSTNAFDFDLSLSRYRTLLDSDYTTRADLNTTAGTLVKLPYTQSAWDNAKTKPGWTGGTGAWVDNATNRGYLDAYSIIAYDVCTPTHIFMQGGENDRSLMLATQEQVWADMVEMTNIIKATHPSIIIGYMTFPEQGAIFPERYPRVVHSPRIVSGQTWAFKFDTLLQTKLGTYSDQQAAGKYYVPVWATMIPYSNKGDSVGYDAIGELLVNGLTSDTNNAIHPGLIADNSIGDTIYSFICNTIS